MTEASSSRGEKFLFSTYRWLGTVVLECGLGTFFLCFPGLTQELLGVTNASREVGILFQLYGVLLLHRGLTQQILCARRDVALFRKFLIASLPFSIGSAVILSMAIIEGRMGAIVGSAVVVTFVIEVVDNIAIYVMTRDHRAVLSPVGSRLEGAM